MHEVRWGARAKLEIKRSVVLQIISNLYRVDAKSFRQQYEQVVKEEGENAMENQVTEGMHDDDEEDNDDDEEEEE